MRAAILMAVLVAAAARADNPNDEARAAYDAGSSEYDLGHYQEALLDFEKAFKLRHVPALLFNIAQCHRMLGEMKEAATVYRSFIAKDPQNSRIVQARTLLAQVEAAVSSQNKALTAKPTDLTAQKDPPPDAAPKAPRVESPAARAEPPAAAPVLPASPAPVASAQPPRAPAPVAKAGGEPQPGDEVALVDAKRGRAVVPSRAIAPKPVAIETQGTAGTSRHRVWTWVAAGGAVAAAGAGLAFGAHSKSTQSSLSDSLHSGAEVQSLQASQVSDAHRANALFLVSGLLAAAGVAFFLMEF